MAKYIIWQLCSKQIMHNSVLKKAFSFHISIDSFSFLEGAIGNYLYYKLRILTLKKSCVFATNLNFLIPISLQPDGVPIWYRLIDLKWLIVWNISLQPDVIDLWYFKLWILKDQIISLKYQKFTHKSLISLSTRLSCHSALKKLKIYYDLFFHEHLI